MKLHYKKRVIYIYLDEGVSEESMYQIISMLKKFLGKECKIEMINAQQIIEKDWARDADLIVMSGGEDLLYAKKLNGEGNQRIKSFVLGGGAYLGICAGAYYASGYVEFDKGGEHEVLGERELAFFPDKMIGPNFGKYSYENNSGARAVEISAATSGKVALYYNGGGYFSGAEKCSDVDIMGSYYDRTPAIVHIRYGKGNVVLSGVHFEHDDQSLDCDDQFLAKIIPAIKSTKSNREKLIYDIIGRLKLGDL